MTEKCAMCKKDIVNVTYVPMDEWNITGNLCSECYSEKIGKHYPGTVSYTHLTLPTIYSV